MANIIDPLPTSSNGSSLTSMPQHLPTNLVQSKVTSTSMDLQSCPDILWEPLKAFGGADGTIDVEEVSAAGRVWKSLHNHNKGAKKFACIAVCGIAIIICAVCPFAVWSFYEPNVTKISKKGELVDPSTGGTVRVESADTFVGEDGNLRVRNSSGEDDVIGSTRTAILLPLLEKTSGRRLSDGRRLLDALGLDEEEVEESEVDAKATAHVIRRAQNGATDFLTNGKRREHLELGFLEDLSGEELTDERTADLTRDEHGFGFMVVCPTPSQCSVFLPKLTPDEMFIKRNGTGNSSRRLADGTPRRLGFFRTAWTAWGYYGHAKSAHNAASLAFSRRRSCFPADARVGVFEASDTVADPRTMKTVAMSALAAGQNVITGYTGTSVTVGPVLVEIHSPAENNQQAEYLQLAHEAGELVVSTGHFIHTFEHGLLPASEVAVGDSLIAVLPDDGAGWAANRSRSYRIGNFVVAPSKVSERRFVWKSGKYAKLTYSGDMVVDGVFVSSYTMDEFNKYVANPGTRDSFIKRFGFSGINSLMHWLSLPLRLGHWYTPRYFDNSFFSPSDQNMEMSRGDGMPLYVDFAGRIAGRIIDIIV